MSRRRRQDEASPLLTRLEALDAARRLGEGRLPGPALEAARAVLEHASQRRSLSADHTVIGFFGATGSGKSSLFNAVTGQGLARTAATRPTTREPLAGIWGPAGSGPLLDWLQVGERHELDTPLGSGAAGRVAKNRDAGGLILLDLPDVDSTSAENREIARRLAGQVDVLVWVLDPQKYADAAVHHGFIRPLAAHDAVTLVVLNQIDRLPPVDVEPVMQSLRGVLAEDGLTAPRLFAVSAVSGQGIDGLCESIAGIAAERGAATQRLAADLGAAAAAMATAAGDPGSNVKLEAPEKKAEHQLAEQLAAAAGVDVVVSATRRSYRMTAAARTGWPVTRWLGRLRPDPLRRLNLKSREVNPALNRTSLPAAGAAQRAQADSAVRSFADATGQGATEPWRAAIRRAAQESSDTLPDALDQAIARTDLGANRGSWWWPLVGLVQWVAFATALGGAGWLAALAVLGYLQFETPPAPTVQGFPVPTLMLLGGVLLGIVLGLASSLFARMAAAGRARTARRRLLAAVAEVAHRDVAAPVAAEIQRFNDFDMALRSARG